MTFSSIPKPNLIPTFIIVAIISLQVLGTRTHFQVEFDQTPSSPHKNYQTPWPWRRSGSQQFQPYHRSVTPIVKKCDGKKNIIDDLGIITFIMSIFSTIVGFGFDLILSLAGNKIAIISTILSLLFGVPSSLISFFNITNPFTYLFSNGLNVLSLSTVFFAATSLTIGTMGLITDILFEIFGFLSLFLSAFSTFPELIDEVIEASYIWGYGDKVKDFVESYGCHNPYVYG